MSGGGTTTNQIQNKDPWGPSVPYLGDIMAQSKSLYDSGAGSKTWGGPLIAGQSPQTQLGINALTYGAQAQMPNAAQPLAYGQNQIAHNGLTSGYNLPMDVFGGVGSGATGINTGGDYGAIGSGANSINTGGLYSPIANGQSPITTGDQYANVGQQGANIGANQAGILNSLSGQASGMANNMGPTSSSQNLGGMASGADAGKDPYLMQMLQDNANLIGNRVASQMSGSGRLGSYGYGDQMARSITAANAPILSNAYQGDKNRQLSAAGQIDSSQRALDASRQGALSLGGSLASNAGSMGLAGLSTQLSGLQGQTGVQQQNISNQLAGIAGLTGVQGQNISNQLAGLQGQTGVQGQNINNQMAGAAGQAGILNSGQQNAAQWAGMIPQLSAAANAPGNQLMAIGDYQNQYNQQNIDAQRQLFEQQQQMPWTQLNRYMGGVSGLGNIIGQSGTTTGNSQTQNQTPWTQMAGLGIAGLGLLSDRDEKTDIKKLGDDPATGLPMYSYRYRDDPKSYPKVVGPMAQDIEEAMPGSTDRLGGKLYVKPETLGILAYLSKKKAA